jgi:hypothetical protein
MKMKNKNASVKGSGYQDGPHKFRLTSPCWRMTWQLGNQQGQRRLSVASSPWVGVLDVWRNDDTIGDSTSLDPHSLIPRQFQYRQISLPQLGISPRILRHTIFFIFYFFLFLSSLTFSSRISTFCVSRAAFAEFMVPFLVYK